MDHAAVAKKIWQAILEHADDNGRVLSDKIVSDIEGVLRAEAPATNWYGGTVCLNTTALDGRSNGDWPATSTEWR